MAGMIFDAHVHILPERICKNPQGIMGTEPWFDLCHRDNKVIASAEVLIAEMDRVGVDRALCYTWPFASPQLCAEANDYLAAVVKKYPHRLTGFGVVQPQEPGAKDEVLRCARLGLRGIGELNADAQGWSLLDNATVNPVVQASLECDLFWTLHCSEPVGHEYPGKGKTTPDLLVKFINRYSELKLFCAHLGGGLPLYHHMPEIKALCEQVWFDTAAAPFVYKPSVYEVLVEAGLGNRLLFGSDYPLLSPQRYFTEWAGLEVPKQTVDAIMGNTLAQLL